MFAKGASAKGGYYLNAWIVCMTCVQTNVNILTFVNIQEIVEILLIEVLFEMLRKVRDMKYH